MLSDGAKRTISVSTPLLAFGLFAILTERAGWPKPLGGR
jgi:hypothetical protein